MESKELVLRIGGNRTRRAKAVKLDTVGASYRVDRAFERDRVELVSDREQGAYCCVEDFVAQIFDRIVVVDSKLGVHATAA